MATTKQRTSSGRAGKGGGRPAAGKGSPGRVRAAGGRAARHLSERAADVLGVALAVLTILLVLGLWFDLGGLFGRILQVSVKGLFGPVGYALPVVAAFWSFILMRNTPPQVRGRMLVGLSITAVGVLGLVSLARGNPSPAAGYEALSRAGGAVGAVVAWPLSRVLSVYGAGVVCAGVGLIGLLVFTGIPIAVLWRTVVDSVRRRRREPEAVPEPGPRPRPRPVALDDDAVPIGSRELRPSEPEPAVIAETKQIRLPLRGGDGGYRLPPVELLRRAPATASDSRDAEHTMQALESTFRSFGVPARVAAAHRGPTVTMYEVEVDAGTKVNRVLSLSSEIAYALATPDVRIIAPIPGKSAIGVEVPNKVRDFVTLGDVLGSKVAAEVTKPLYVGLGKDVHGRAVLVNLAEMPHLLIAGATGAGKSSCINAFVTSLLVRTSPDDVKLILVDPKRVELSHFADVPHLLSPVIIHPEARRGGPVLGGAGDGDALRAARRGRDAGHRRLQHRPSGGDAAHPAGGRGEVRTSSLHRRGDRRAGRPHDGRPSGRGGRHLPDRPDGPGGRHPSRGGHPAAERRRGDRADQGQHPSPGSRLRPPPRPTRGSSSTSAEPRSWSATAICCSSRRTSPRAFASRGHGSPKPRSRPLPSGAGSSGARCSTPRSRGWASRPRTTRWAPTRTRSS